MSQVQVKLRCSRVGASGLQQAGSRITVSRGEAGRLVAGGNAEYVDGAIEAMVTQPAETAMKARPMPRPMPRPIRTTRKRRPNGA